MGSLLPTVCALAWQLTHTIRRLSSSKALGLLLLHRCSHNFVGTNQDNAYNSLHRKPLRTGGSADGRPRVNGAVRTGSQVPADWHVQLRHDPCIENSEKRSTSAQPSTITCVRQLPSQSW